MSPATAALLTSAARVMWAIRGGKEPEAHIARLIHDRLSNPHSYDPRAPSFEECERALRFARIEALETSVNRQI